MPLLFKQIHIFPIRALVALLLVFSAWGNSLEGARNPRLQIDSDPRSKRPVGSGGLTVRYKRASGPLGFGGDMMVWGLRGFGGNLSDPKLGLMAAQGTLNGHALKLNLRQFGLTVERGFNPDPRFKWRVNFGGGTYHMQSRVSGNTVKKGSFTFLEPMLVGVHPLTRHIIAEAGVGYTFAGANGLRIEGIFLEVNLLLGLF